MNDTKTIFVGLSGGVDSAVAAKRLIDEGHCVVGVFIKVWQPDFLSCNWEAERLDAMRVAAHLGIPFRTFDAVTVYKEHVADYLVREYAAGRTPNPDVMCNEHVKFGVFLDWAISEGADAIATGHYAQVQAREGTHILLRGCDNSKDQSYFLWSLTEEQLSRTLFPIGNSHKHEVRREAECAGLPVFDKRDSQGICFLGAVDIKDFLRHYVTAVEGPVYDASGRVIGVHDGAIFYTIGQRHGFTITEPTALRRPQYVIAKDMMTNTIIVSSDRATCDHAHNTIKLFNVRLRTEMPTFKFSAQCRYHQQPILVMGTLDGHDHAMLTVQSENVELPSEGQSCVFYVDEECIGGGIVSVIS